jgi:uncharacterized protein (TIGR03000 family)
VWFDEDATQQTGEWRSFSSPRLSDDRVYHYTVRAKWNENGRVRDQSRRIDVRAGRRTMVDFFLPETKQ